MISRHNVTYWKPSVDCCCIDAIFCYSDSSSLT